MISIMELTEKKTPLIKNSDRKKGMTLVEVMAAMAILSILFIAISGMISGIVKSESKSNKLLDNASIAKSILSMFEVSGDKYITYEKFNGLVKNENDEPNKYNFNTIESIKNQILGVGDSDGDKYTLKLKIVNKPNDSNLYKVTVTVYDNIKDAQTKYMYIYRAS